MLPLSKGQILKTSEGQKSELHTVDTYPDTPPCIWVESIIHVKTTERIGFLLILTLKLWMI